MNQFLNEPYENQVEIDKVKSIIADIYPGLTPHSYSLDYDRRIVTSIAVRVPVKGNKDVIAKLVSAGFVKGHKRKVESGRKWPVMEGYSFDMILRYYFPKAEVFFSMTDTINGRTPEEIKKGLESCSVDGLSCSNCSYCVSCDADIHALERDALAYIQRLERERDAAVERLARYKKCIDCRRYPEIKKNLFCDDCVQGDKWQWCGEPLEVK